MKATFLMDFKSRFFILLTLLFLSYNSLEAAILERTVSVKFNNLSLKDALDELAQQAHFEWSYNAAILQADKKVSMIAREVSVCEALIRMLGTEYEFKENGNYLILKKPRKPQNTLSGYISDGKTGQKVPNVTVYDRKTLKSSTTDENGFYQLPVPSSAEVVVSRLGYRDTVLYVTSQAQPFQKITLNHEGLPKALTTDAEMETDKLSLATQKAIDKFTKSYQRINSLNVRDSLTRNAQISLLPWVGTNMSMSAAVRNNWSLNLFMGYSAGNRILEVGGVGNMTKQKMTGMQIAGVFNQVSGVAQGWQIAGLWNQVNRAEYGVQFSGFANVNSQSKHQLIQAAGFLNRSGKGTVQLQAAGFLNLSDTLQGLQASGFINRANCMNGIQVSGFANRAKKLNGMQVGIINRADTIKGVQIGFYNRSKTGGYNRLEASWNETTPYNFSVKTGIPALYFILTAGYSDGHHKDFFCYGGGVGARAGRRVGISLDAIWRHTQFSDQPIAMQEWAQGALCLDIRLNKRFSIAAGPSANLLMSDVSNSYYLENRQIIATKERIFEEASADFDFVGWLGATGGLRVRF